LAESDSVDSFLDVVGEWTEIKLRIVREYAKAYSLILRRHPELNYSYIDAFAGAGSVISRGTGEKKLGSSLLALGIKPKFHHYHFVEMDHARADELRRLAAGRKDVTIHEGDCNLLLLKDVFPKCRYEDYCRALCLFDPYELNPRWEIVQTAGKMRSIEMFLNFMIMDANRNVLWANPDGVRVDQIERMNAFWGDDSWREAAYEARRGLFGDMIEKRTYEAIIQAYRKRLKEKGGFKFVPDPIPMRNMKGAPIYYLFFASHNEAGNKIATSIFKKYRTKGLAHGV
jgi:three-Cys-motif partner protein